MSKLRVSVTYKFSFNILNKHYCYKNILHLLYKNYSILLKLGIVFSSFEFIKQVKLIVLYCDK